MGILTLLASVFRVEVIRKNNVPEFGPPLPNPPLFYDDQTLQQFLTVKRKYRFRKCTGKIPKKTHPIGMHIVIGAENAALKCDNFAIPNNRARAGIIEGMVEKGRAQGAPSATTTTTIPIDMPPAQNQQQRRPKSSSGDRFSRNSLRSIRSNPDNGTSSLFSDSNHGKQSDPPLPPVPSPTRSTMLQDLKKFALRRAPALSPLQHRSVEEEKEAPTVAIHDDETPRTYYTSTPPPDHGEKNGKRALQPLGSLLTFVFFTK